MDFASSNFREGTPVQTERVARYTGADLVTLRTRALAGQSGRPYRVVVVSPAGGAHVSSREAWLESSQSACGPAVDTASRRSASSHELNSGPTAFLMHSCEK